MKRTPTSASEDRPAEDGPFELALAGAASLLEMVGGGRLICDPRSFPVVRADPAVLMLGSDDGYWPEAS